MKASMNAWPRTKWVSLTPMVLTSMSEVGFSALSSVGQLLHFYLLTSIPPGQVNRVSAYWLGLKRGTCVGWQVTLCDPIWQVMSRSCEMGVPTAIYIRSYTIYQVVYT